MPFNKNYLHSNPKSIIYGRNLGVNERKSSRLRKTAFLQEKILLCMFFEKSE